jgi:hypothetical protein
LNTIRSGLAGCMNNKINENIPVINAKNLLLSVKALLIAIKLVAFVSYKESQQNGIKDRAYRET